MQTKHYLKQFVVAAAWLLAGVMAGCHGQAAQTASAGSVNSANPAQQTYDSPQQAAAALKEAVDLKDDAMLLAIFGPDGHDLIFSGDPVQQSNKLDSIAKHMGEQLRVDLASPEKAVLYIGAANWPFPIPVVSDGSKWHFDTAAGKEEILNRRIGQNELGSIDVCREFVRAEKEYVSKPRTDDRVIQYARKFSSTPGKHDGLYWESTGADDFSPLGSLLALAETEGYGTMPVKHRQPYHGYVFHILTAQGAAAPGGALSYVVDDRMTKGFAFIAYPAEWGNTGVMTFIVNQDGKVYQKDLGADTANLAKAIKEYNPDTTWQEVKE